MTPAVQSARPTLYKDERRSYMRRLVALQNERSSWISHWQELNDYILPRRLRYLQAERNRGTKRHDKILNNTATRAAGILGAGKTAGQTSPARPWFRYEVVDQPLVGDAWSQRYLAIVEKEVYLAFARSNLYGRLQELWFLEGVFATAVLYVEEDEEHDVRGEIFPLGQYVLYSTGKGRIDGIMREFDCTVEQVVCEFGLENCSERVRMMWEKQQYDAWVTIIHVIEPNLSRDTGKIDDVNMPFRARWMEKSVGVGSDPEFLRRSGYEEQPFMTARWDAVGEDIYGSGSPGMNALGDGKGLQKLEGRKLEAVDKMLRPPLKAPVSAKAQRVSLLPGEVTYVDESASTTKFSPVVEVRPEGITAADQAGDKNERRIYSTFFADLFQMFLLDPAQQPRTATDINKRYEEKLLMLGPVVERDNTEVLDPLHRRVIGILNRRGKLPPVPPQLRGRRVKVEYISIMAQAQKLLGTASTERFTSFVGSTSAVEKKVLAVPNWVQIVKNYAEMLGMRPDEINPDDVIAQLVAAQEQAQQQAQEAALMTARAQAAKSASQADTSGDNMLTRLMQGAGQVAPTPYGQA